MKTLNVTVSLELIKVGVSMNRKLVEPSPGALEFRNVMKGPTLGDSPAIVMFGELVIPVLLLSTKLPLSVHVGEGTSLRMAQATFCRRRHQPRRPPLAKIRPGRPAVFSLGH